MDWATVGDRVTALRGKDVFGANGHRFELAPPLSEAELAEAEQQFGVELPRDYRDFLTQVGAGGAGPSYGVFPLRRIDGRWGWEGDGAELTLLDQLDTPFPAEPLPQDVLDEIAADEPDDEDSAEYEDWVESEEAVWWDPDRTVGAICLCEEGCAYRVWLVVSGPERGFMWQDRRADLADLAPLTTADGERVTFARWYSDWLLSAEGVGDPSQA